MDPTDVQKMIALLKADEDALAEMIAQAENRLARARAARLALEALDGPDEPVEFEGKLADACREVLKRAGGKALLPTEVRDQFKVIGYDASIHKNAMASVHSVLKRLAAPGKDVRRKESKDGTRYFWATSVGPLTTARQRSGTMADLLPPSVLADMASVGSVYRETLAAINKQFAEIGSFEEHNKTMGQIAKELGETMARTRITLPPTAFSEEEK